MGDFNSMAQGCLGQYDKVCEPNQPTAIAPAGQPPNGKVSHGLAIVYLVPALTLLFTKNIAF